MELSVPLTLQWDLADPPDLQLTDHVIHQLESIPILSIHITLNGGLPPWLRDRLDAPSLLPGRGIILTIPIDDAGDLPPLRRVQTLFVALGKESDLKRCAADGGWPAVSLPPSCVDDPLRLPPLLREAYAVGVRAVHLPIPRYRGGDLLPYPPPHLLRLLADEMASSPPPPDLRLTVHDPFLWEALFPGTGGWSSGCQGGNAQIHLDGTGVVRGCPLLPEPLGCLTETSLGEILSGDRRRRLREAIMTLPDGCRGCERAPRCQGGCRGRGFIAGGETAPDPVCPLLAPQGGMP